MMSGSASLSNDVFSEAERVDIRRFCGYPAYGAGDSGFQSWRFFQSYGTLEFRLSNMAPSERQVVRQYLVNLYDLEQALPAASDSLDTQQASVWTRNKSELVERARLLHMWARRLTGFLGVPIGPALNQDCSIVI